jgi:hypothetical protein
MPDPERKIAVRWTIGAVSDYGFEALRLSIWGAWRIFGDAALYRVCVNTLPLDLARARTGALPCEVAWRATDREIPEFLRPHLDAGMAEGVGWKLAPVRSDPDRYTLALDNDCILWELPAALESWLEGHDPRGCVLAADVMASFGQFASLCGSAALNCGIRGLPPDFDLEAALRWALTRVPVQLTSELDEQGLQVAALSNFGTIGIVTLDEVTICSPFPPHLPGLGRCGAHFVGLNAHEIPWSYLGRPALEVRREHWREWRGEVYRRVGVRAPESGRNHPP